MTDPKVVTVEPRSGKQNISDLIKKRGTLQGCITKIQNLIAMNGKELTKYELETRLGLLESYFAQAMLIQGDIENLDGSEEHAAKRDLLEESYCSTKSKMLALIAEENKPVTPKGIDTQTSFSVNSMRAIKLPKLKLPHFSGKYTEWLDFFNAFKTLVDDDHEISDIEKFVHLKSCLGEIPLKVIQSLEITSENYGQALKLLKTRFDNKNIIFQSHVKELFDIPRVNKCSGRQLRDLVDSVTVHLRSLHSLGETQNILDAILLHLMFNKVDSETQVKWEEQRSVTDLPNWEKFRDFLMNRCTILDNRDIKYKPSISHAQTKNDFKPCSSKRQTSLVSSSKGKCCPCCNNRDHIVSQCTRFLKMTPMERYYEAKRLSVCLICLQQGHPVKNCSQKRCVSCNGLHHVLLHRSTTRSSTSFGDNNSQAHLQDTHDRIPSSEQFSKDEGNLTATTTVSSLKVSVRSSKVLVDEEQVDRCDHVILATAIIYIRDSSGSHIPCRALLDSASQSNFITERLVHKLQLRKSKTNGAVSGIGDVSAHVRHKVTTTIKSRSSVYEAQLEFWVLRTITDMQPKCNIHLSDLNMPKDLVLADPYFHKPQPVDILLGAGVFFQLLLSGQIRLGENLPVLQETSLGWIVSGKIEEASGRVSAFCSSLNETEHHVYEPSMATLLERFWVIESTDNTPSTMTREQEQCEAHFLQNVSRTSSGRFKVKLPFRQHPSILGNSELSSRRRMLNLEKRLTASEDLRLQYREFMSEYEGLGHMEEIDSSVLLRSNFFLPHHCVLRPESSSTKLRVVFDASARTSNGISLNDLLMVGPPVQPELFDIILRFRLHKYAVTADISKMYRQILVNEDDCDYQCIYWRDNSQESLKIYRLKTVTYGTSAAPYLATRCLKYLADSESDSYPLGARTINADFYVDDMLTGADTKEEARQIMKEVKLILAKGCFELRKWCTNDQELLAEIPEDETERMLNLHDVHVVKALGNVWTPSSDELHFFASDIQELNLRSLTKRDILSKIARIFDPLGLINPVTVLAKIFMQELWILKLGWDEPLPIELQSKFEDFYRQLKCANLVRFPRFVLPRDGDNAYIELHGFSDASNRAYGCCIFVRTFSLNGHVTVNLLCSKSRVAPIKTISLPRLELCGAQILAQLLRRVCNNLGNLVKDIYCWTDSKIVLDWLAAHPSNWTTFVANRVSSIQQLLPNAIWRHVTSKDNPADLVSRGVVPLVLQNSTLWFNGPSFLQAPKENWPSTEINHNPNALEKRKAKSCLAASCSKNVEDLVQQSKFVNSFRKLQRTFAYMLRFVNNCKAVKDHRTVGELTAEELAESLRTILWIAQQVEYREEYLQLERNSSVSPKSCIKSLNPFLDDSSKKRLIKVGGRLQNADLPVATKFPILLPKRHPITSSLIVNLHNKNFHAGPQALIAIIRQRFWLVNARDVARRVVRCCIRCIRSRPFVLKQIMGNLPSHRVEPARPFIVSGVDFCGPIWIYFKVRGKRPQKAYIALFICFSTKAVHLEVVSDLSSDAFVAALRRFIARRGRCRFIYCDNATNFVGAKRKLQELHISFNSQQFQDSVVRICAEDGITFKMIPPRTPHFGGLWEAAIKSAKTLLQKTINSVSLTFEELTTVVAQIEAILNSRPLTPMSSDPSDFEALTPGHFLVGEPLTAIVEPDVTSTNLSHLSRWQRISALNQHFWKRWSKEYVVQLQQRSKWLSSTPNITVDSLVLVADDQLPPQKWLLGRVVEAIMGSDGKVRVVNVQTKNGIIKRGIQKICPIPIDTSTA